MSKIILNQLELLDANSSGWNTSRFPDIGFHEVLAPDPSLGKETRSSSHPDITSSAEICSATLRLLMPLYPQVPLMCHVLKKTT